MTYIRLPAQRWLLASFLLLLLSSHQPVSATRYQKVWDARPPLSYFALTAGLQSYMRLEAQLSPVQFAQVQHIAEGEQAQLRRLLEASQSIIADPALSLEHKRLYIQRTGFNRRIDAILYASDRSLRLVLDTAAYTRLVAWMERRWPLEVRLHGRTPATLNRMLLPDLLPWVAPLSAPRTYEIFATRYDAKGRYTAALPDQCVKLTNGGLGTCADKGYIAGQRYEIFMSYKKPVQNTGGKKGVGVVVGEAGPWNIDDNFWATLADPTPRRMFADLPLGMPEAQAAFYNGYNGGLDQYGRKVTAPFAIDLAFEVADDLGLPAKTNDWINVSFMWTDGWGSGAAQSSGSASGSQAGQPAAISPVETTTYKPDGSQVHTVQPGETLWAIALAYGVTIQQLRELNGLPAPSAENQSEVILPGQTLIVWPAGPTPDGRGGSETRPYNQTQTSPRNATPVALATRPPATPVVGVVDPGGKESAETTGLGYSITPALPYLIGGLVLAGLGLYGLGKWLSRP